MIPLSLHDVSELKFSIKYQDAFNFFINFVFIIIIIALLILFMHFDFSNSSWQMLHIRFSTGFSMLKSEIRELYDGGNLLIEGKIDLKKLRIKSFASFDVFILLITLKKKMQKSLMLMLLLS